MNLFRKKPKTEEDKIVFQKTKFRGIFDIVMFAFTGFMSVFIINIIFDTKAVLSTRTELGLIFASVVLFFCYISLQIDYQSFKSRIYFKTYLESLKKETQNES